MTNTIIPNQANASRARHLLAWSGRVWFVSAAIGQISFVVFILAFYGSRIVSGNNAAWNDRSLIDGYIVDDIFGNSMFAVHVLLAAIMTMAGIVQLIPRIREYLPIVHRICGRIFLLTACLLAIGGLWLTWLRGTYLHISGAYAITIDAILILIFATLTVKNAILRNISTHQHWAMRLFLAANAVWFLRVSIMAWVIIAQGPVGMNKDMSGPVDMFMIFACYLIPLGIYEIYRLAVSASVAWFKLATASLVFLAAGFTVLGVFGAIAFMWLPSL